MDTIRKYPRTQHIQGSHHLPGDDELGDVPYESVAGQFVVLEEKLDGSVVGLSFEENGELRLQTRAQYLSDDAPDLHFDLFKSWARTHREKLFERLGHRFLMYGEWLYPKRTIFYDQLPHYFLEFDILDKKEDCFLSTSARQATLQGLPITSVPVVRRGIAPAQNDLDAWIRESPYISPNSCSTLQKEAERLGHPAELHPSQEVSRSEGLYIKIEAQGRVKARYQYLRPGSPCTDSDIIWQNRPLLPNLLHPGVDIFNS